MAQGYKDFTAGMVLTAADLEDYCQNQTTMRFASASARDTALSAVLTEGLRAYLIDTNSECIYSGAAWSTIGPVHGGEVAYSPTLTNLTIGNGAVVANYRRFGRDIRTSGRITFGTTTTMGTGPRITLPVAPANELEIESEAGVKFFDSSTGSYNGRIGGELLYVSGSTVEFVGRSYASAPVTQVTSTSPLTWATSDVIWWKIWYEAAADG